MNISAHLEQHIIQNYEQAVHWRRYLHENPELSFHEQKTSAWLKQQLENMGCVVRTCASNYGLIVDIHGEEEGPMVALRADIDALPIQDEKQVSYASKVPNVMHACGHDGHTAALLLVASFYMKHRSQIKGTRRLLFQPAEELAPGGAAAMIAEGVMQDVNAVYGVHLWSPLPYGQFSTKPGYFMSAVDDFVIEIQGLGGHGGMPHESHDAILIGTQFVQALQSIVSRNVNPIQPAVITVGSFQSGNAFNIIAERCFIKGTIRTFDETTRTYIQERVERLLASICEMNEATYTYELRKGYPAVVNDDQEAQRILQLAEQLFGEENVKLAEPLMIAEDFSYYLKEKPGCFMFVGAGNTDCGATYAHHHPKFDIDERSIQHAASILVHSAEQYANL